MIDSGRSRTIEHKSSGIKRKTQEANVKNATLITFYSIRSSCIVKPSFSFLPRLKKKSFFFHPYSYSLAKKGDAKLFKSIICLYTNLYLRIYPFVYYNKMPIFPVLCKTPHPHASRRRVRLQWLCTLHMCIVHVVIYKSRCLNSPRPPEIWHHYILAVFSALLHTGFVHYYSHTACAY